MYNRLRTAWPNGHVLAQVAMSALLRTRKQADRNRFDRKVCDFVLVDKSFVVKVIIELDDSSHRGRENADRTRDTMLKRAGYETLRFVNVPDANELVAGLAAFEPASSQIYGVS